MNLRRLVDFAVFCVATLLHSYCNLPIRFLLDFFTIHNGIYVHGTRYTVFNVLNNRSYLEVNIDKNSVWVWVWFLSSWFWNQLHCLSLRPIDRIGQLVLLLPSFFNKESEWTLYFPHKCLIILKWTCVCECNEQHVIIFDYNNNGNV